MYHDKSIAVIIPCYNEGTQIEKVINSLPQYVDKIVVIDDFSQDNTVDVVQKFSKQNSKIILLKHDKNQGCGGSLATGYKWARDNRMCIAVRMDGDGQMDPNDLSNIIDPVVFDEADYAKGNRLFTGKAYRKIPKIRYFGNSILSFLTKIASGYWHIADSQTGYTAINSKALNMLDWDSMYKRYGQPNDLLVMLNVNNMRVKDVPVEPIYNVGEKAGIRLQKVVFSISWLLLRRFLWRLKEKYIIRDFHPLVFFYLLGFLFSFLTVALSIRLSLIFYYDGVIRPINALAMMFSFMSGSLFILFAMWFDMETNRNLKGGNEKK